MRRERSRSITLQKATSRPSIRCLKTVARVNPTRSRHRRTGTDCLPGPPSLMLPRSELRQPRVLRNAAFADEAESLQRRIEALKYSKSEMPEAEYEEKLEALLVRLAEVNAKLRKR